LPPPSPPVYIVDNFELSIPLTVPGFEIANCGNDRLGTFLHGSLLNGDGSLNLTKQTRLLPDNRGWETHCNFDSSAIRLSRPLLDPEGGGGGVDPSSCEIRVLVRRRTAPFVYKALFPVVITVITGLLGLFLDPRVAPLVTGRCSLLIIAMLLTINIARAAPTFAYDTWYDGWSMMQLIILTTGIFETIIVHVLTKFPRPELPLAVDEAARIFIPLLYVVLASYMLASETIRYYTLNEDLARSVSSCILGLGLVGIMLVSYKWYAYKVNVRVTRKRAILKRLAEADPEDNERSKQALTEAFRFFDADGSGDISRHELLELLGVIHHRLSKKHIMEAIEEFNQEAITEEEFLGVIERLNTTCQEYARSHPELVKKQRANSVITRGKSSRVGTIAEDSISKIQFDRRRRKQALAEVAAKTAVIGAFQPTPKGDDELSSSSAVVRSPGRCRFEPE